MANRKDAFLTDSMSGKINLTINSTTEEWQRAIDFQERRLFIYGDIMPLDESLCGDIDGSMISHAVENIMTYNRLDMNLPPEERVPIMLYINSPGGDVTEGFSLISAIELSKTPIYTVNVGQWSSMSFWIGITGHKRFSLPHMRFLMHDGSTVVYGSANKAQDCMEFTKRFGDEVIKPHVLKHSKMKPIDYDALSRVEVYMLPEDALERGFIDEIVTDIDDIL